MIKLGKNSIRNMNIQEEIKELLGWDDEEEKTFYSDLSSYFSENSSKEKILNLIKAKWGYELSSIVSRIIEEEIKLMEYE